MKPLQLAGLAGLALSAMSASCEKNSNASEPAPDPLVATLRVGQSAAVGPFAATLVAVQDLRCPRENCSTCYGGYATVQVDVALPGQAPQRLAFRRISCLPAAPDLRLTDSTLVDLHRVAGYTIGLVNMSEASSKAPLAPGDYTVKLLVKKS